MKRSPKKDNSDPFDGSEKEVAMKNTTTNPIIETGDLSGTRIGVEGADKQDGNTAL